MPGILGGNPVSIGTVRTRGGKRYRMVWPRTADFRQTHPIADGWGITTEFLPQPQDDVIICKACIVHPKGNVVATGHAQQIIPPNDGKRKTGADQTNPWEVCETSAIGRALNAAGYPGDDDLAQEAERLQEQVNEATQPQPKPEQRQAPQPAAQQPQPEERPRPQIVKEPPAHKTWKEDQQFFLQRMRELKLDAQAVADWCHSKVGIYPHQMSQERRARVYGTLAAAVKSKNETLLAEVKAFEQGGNGPKAAK